MAIIDNYMFRPLLAIFRLSSREPKVLLYTLCAHVVQRYLHGVVRPVCSVVFDYITFPIFTHTTGITHFQKKLYTARNKLKCVLGKKVTKKFEPYSGATWLTGISLCRTFTTQPPTQWVEWTVTGRKPKEVCKSKRRLQQEMGLKIWGILHPFLHRFSYCGVDRLIFYLSRWTTRRLTGHYQMTQWHLLTSSLSKVSHAWKHTRFREVCDCKFQNYFGKCYEDVEKWTLRVCQRRRVRWNSYLWCIVLAIRKLR